MSNTEKEKLNNGSTSFGKLKDSLRDGTFRDTFNDWKWIFRYSRKYKAAIIGYTLLGIVSSTLGVAGSVAGKYLIDIITGYETSKLWIVAIIMFTSSILSIVFNNLLNRMLAKLNIRINNDIQADIYQTLIDADWLEINKFSNGDILNRFNGDISVVSSNAVNWVPTIVIALYNFVITFAVLLHYDVILAVIALASAPVLLLSSRFFIRKQREYARRTREVGSELMSFEAESFYNLDTIKSFGIGETFGRRMGGLLDKYKNVSLAHNMFTIKTNIWMSSLGMIVRLGAFAYCLYALWTHIISFGTMTLFLQQSNSLSSAFNSIVGIVPTFLNSAVSARRIRELAEIKPEDGEVGAELESSVDAGYAVRMDGVNFAYIENENVITDTHFEADPGEIVALIGPSGEGKTTMIRLMLGLVKPENGDVYISPWIDGGQAGERISMTSQIRQLFSYVPQGNTMLSGTIADNLRMVKEDASDDELTAALKEACAWDFVEKMPAGIYTNIGEKGKGLSEGQAQRVAIARAILRNASILLLDEATSALDVETERNVLRNIIKNDKNKTVIVTTHRPSVLSMCNKVYRVVDTKLTELDREESARQAMDF